MNDDTTAPGTKTAFYFRAPGKRRRWRLIGVYDSPELAWRAALEFKGSGDLWFPEVPAPSEPDAPTLVTSATT